MKTIRTAESADRPQKTFWRRFIWLSLFATCGFAILISLGNWQMRRLAWKEALITDVQMRLSRPPQALSPLQDWDELQPQAYRYTRVRVSGRFLHDLEQRVYWAQTNTRLPYSGTGFLVMTPLELKDKTYVFVNRGFVPQEQADAEKRTTGQVEGVVTFTGLMRAPEVANFATPGGGYADGLWFVRTPARMAGLAGLAPDRVAPFFIDAEANAPGGLPQAGTARVAFPNRHLSYALTWYGLALALAGVFAVFIARAYRAHSKQG